MFHHGLQIMFLTAGIQFFVYAVATSAENPNADGFRERRGAKEMNKFDDMMAYLKKSLRRQGQAQRLFHVWVQRLRCLGSGSRVFA